ncbi:MAG: DNA primase [Clostridia bacterium]|nr:DNA primase [Clostridia bacterium]
MRISDDVLRSIKERCPIEETISRYVTLKPNGSRYVGLCPFHSEKTPSFTVFSDTQSFYCFGCGAGGDVITFVMREESLEYPEAVKLLADRAGVRVEQNEEEEKAMRLRSRVLAMNRDAARFFHETLVSEAGARGMEYLRKRGLKKKTITHFGIGYAPDSWDALTNHLKSKGYKEEEMISAFLASKGKKGGCYDIFRDRVIFPIIDITGRVVAFGGRRVGDEDPRKYINSSNTPVYRKGQTVFALNFAKGADKLVLTEGYLDTVSLHEAGFTGAVATCGTAITAEQARLLARYFDEVTIAYDSDSAGRTATSKAIELFKPTGISINVLDYKGAKDPDEFIRRYGSEAFGELLYGSGSYVDYRLELLKRDNDITKPDGKVRYINAAVEVIAAEDSPLKREVYASRVAEQTSVDKRTVLTEIEDRRKREGRRELVREQKRQMRVSFGSDDKANPEKRANLRAARAEEEILRCLFANTSAYDIVKTELTDSDFVTEFDRRIFDCIVSVVSDGRTPALSDFNADFDPVAEISAITRIMLDADKEPYDAAALKKAISVLKEEKGRLTGDAIKEMSPEELKDYIAGLKKGGRRKPEAE